MRHVPAIAGALLGLLFLAAGLTYLLGMVPEQPAPPEGSAAAHFMAAFEPTGYLRFVKICEVVGGALVAIPLTRRLGMLVLGPILVNIVAFHVFVMEGEGLMEPMLLAACGLALVVLVLDAHAFLGLLKSARKRPS